MSVWQNKNDKIDKSLMRFSQNYDLKICIGILYLFLYDELILKEKNDFSSLRKEFLFSEIRIIITKHKNLLDKLLKSAELIIENYITDLFELNSQNNSISNNPDMINKKYKSLKKIINNLKFDILNVLCEETKIYFIQKMLNFTYLLSISWQNFTILIQ